MVEDNNELLKDVIRYFLKKNQELRDGSHVTPTKLNKLVYFADFDSFEQKKKSITNQSYYKNNFGPTLRILNTVLKEMEEAGEIELKPTHNYYNAPQIDITLKTEVPISLGKEVQEVLESVFGRYGRLRPNEISEISHRDAPYLATEFGQQIDYDLVKLRCYQNFDEPLVTDDERAQWKDVIDPETAKRFVASLPHG